MIIREREHEFIMIKQYDHACLAGKIAAQVNKNLFKTTDYLDEVIKAASEHDRGWVGLDETPIWNDEENIPYSFQDYPPELKLAFYKKGIDEIETVSPYAALLCSFHFSSFFPNPNDIPSIQFVSEESKRQMMEGGQYLRNISDIIEDYLKATIKKSGNHTHAGKLPERIGGGIQLQRQIDTLKQQLKAYIEEEEFEKAAELRDQIRLLDQQKNEKKEG